MAVKKTTATEATKTEVVQAKVKDVQKAKAPENIMVCLNYPLDLTFRLKDNSGHVRTVTLKGNANELRGKAMGVLPTKGAYGLTSIKRTDWEQIKKEHGDMLAFKNHLLFANEANKVDDEVKEASNVVNGFEPVDTKRTATKEEKQGA